MFVELSKPMLLRRVGFALFGLSFVTPNWRFEGIGAGAFIAVPDLVFHLINEGDAFRDWHATIIIIGLLIGWLSNFTIFSSLPIPVTVLAIVAPWILFLTMIFLLRMPSLDFWVATRIPFYPWALGIGLINWSRLMERTALDVPEGERA